MGEAEPNLGAGEYVGETVVKKVLKTSIILIKPNSRYLDANNQDQMSVLW